MVFENVTQYGRALARVLVEVDSRCLRRKRYLARRAFLLAVGIVAVLCGGFLLLVFGELDMPSRAICVGDLIVGILFLWKGIFFRRMMVWQTVRGMTEGTRRALFTEEEMQVEHPGVQKGCFYYSTVTAFYETEGCFILPLSTGPKNRLTSIVLDKGGFTQGTVAEFRMFIQERTGKAVRFVNCR